MLVTFRQLAATATSLETAASAVTAGVQPIPIGYWRRIAVACETLAGISSTANTQTPGYMVRAAVALESIAGTTGAEETQTYLGRLKRIVDALEVQAGAVYTGSLGNRMQLAAASATFGADVTAPTITSASSTSVAENATLAWSLTASESVTWSIRTSAQNAASVDYTRFELSGSTLRWLSNGTKDYETPNDTGSNNTYVVVIRATDAASNTTDQTFTATVTDVAEGGGSDALLLEAAAGYLLIEGGTSHILLE